MSCRPPSPLTRGPTGYDREPELPVGASSWEGHHGQFSGVSGGSGRRRDAGGQPHYGAGRRVGERTEPANYRRLSAQRHFPTPSDASSEPGRGNGQGQPRAPAAPGHPNRRSGSDSHEVNPDQRRGDRHPSTSANFEGINNLDGVLPPDTNGDIGPNHYVQWVNLHFEIFSRTGTPILGPTPGNALWSGLGGLCGVTTQGDPVVRYDRMADRWVFTQFAFNVTRRGVPVAPYEQCVAVSTSGDPTGSYNRRPRWSPSSWDPRVQPSVPSGLTTSA
jgi:hypothetical protein